ncbi:MAG: hypothetical protein H0W40_13440 [Methylibium sp.]|uniref:capsule assembly Wzi family protein n=1 Tax=Methylibium sp. TaxID=2067992 RepID=UPI0017D50B11|nr:capsule assembly Wzi family protein [Methylibium sp.]MBA3598359.1 hypothetical protein [Methylibium sp.]
MRNKDARRAGGWFVIGSVAACVMAVCPGGQAQAVSADESSKAAGVATALLSPDDTGLREDLAWLIDRRVLSLPLSTWPLPAALLAPALAAAGERSWPAVDADALGRVERALARQTAPVSAGLDVNSARHPALDGNPAAAGAADATLSVRTHGERWSARLQMNVHAHSLSSSGQQGSLSGSYVAVALRSTLLSFGAVDRWWGPGRYTSPILSNAARPFPALTLRRARDDAPQPNWLRWIGPWGYEFSVGQLRHYEPARTRTLGLRLYTRPLPGLEVGLSRHIEWGGRGLPDGLQALRDALLGNSNIDDPERREREDPSNELAGFDLRLSHVDSGDRAWVGHVQLIGEDEANKLPSRFITTAGLQLKHPWRSGRLEWSVEGTDTVRRRLLGLLDGGRRQAAYTHGAYTDGYYHQGLPIGAHFGGGGRIFTGGLSWVPDCRQTCRRYRMTAFTGKVSERELQPINASFGETGDVHGLSARMESQARGFDWYLGLSVQRYRAGPRPDAGLQFGIELPLQR